MTPRNDSSVTSSGRREHLEEDLRRRVLTYKENYGQPIATETFLAGQYRLSRNTVRKVLRKLIDEGLLRSKTGFGIFIVPPEERPVCPSRLRRVLLATEFSGGDVYTRRLVAGVLDYAFVFRSELEVIEYSSMTASRMIDRFRNLKFDALIHDRPGDSRHELISALAEAGIPQVTINRRISGVPALFVDHELAVRDVMTFLWGIGKRRIAFLDLGLSAEVFRRRQQCFLSLLAAAGEANPEAWLCRIGGESDPVGKTCEFLRGLKNPDALFVAHPVLEVVQSAFEVLHITVPEQLSMVLLDEEDRQADGQKFTTLREPVRQLGFAAAELIFNSTPGRKCDGICRYFPGELVIRGSCSLPFATGPVSNLHYKIGRDEK